MSMIGNYYMTDAETIRGLQSGELSTSGLLYGNEPKDAAQRLDIDKTWHAIHFALTGQLYECGAGNPFSKVVLGGAPVNDEDVGYGPATFFTPQEIQAAHTAIGNVTESDFRARFDVKAMQRNDIYPVTEDEDADMFFDYVWYYFQRLQRFYQRAAETGQYILFYIN